MRASAYLHSAILEQAEEIKDIIINWRETTNEVFIFFLYKGLPKFERELQ
jgi:hypothetical protein